MSKKGFIKERLYHQTESRTKKRLKVSVNQKINRLTISEFEQDVNEHLDQLIRLK